MTVDHDVANVRVVSRQLLQELAAMPADDPARGPVRDRLVELHLPLVQHLARRFRDRGEPLDDLVQVGTIGLLKSIDRFDPDRGVEFSTYATPTIIGEIKRHFRDRGWAVRVPRRLQEMRLALTVASSDLTHELGRSPTVPELSVRLGVGQDAVLEGLESLNAYSTVSLDAVDTHAEEGIARIETLRADEPSLDSVENREALKPLLAELDPRDRTILLLRFFHGMTQSQIATELDMSQMHVSRLLSRMLSQLRDGLIDVR